jgi:hypothetical protein
MMISRKFPGCLLRLACLLSFAVSLTASPSQAMDSETDKSNGLAGPSKKRKIPSSYEEGEKVAKRQNQGFF